MATVIYRGDAAAIAQVDTIVVGTYDATTTYAVIINGKSVSVLGQGGTNITTAAALYDALVAAQQDYPEFAEIEFANDTSVNITATSTLPGRNFDLSTSETGGTGTISDSTTTTSSGPSDLACVANYSTGALPSASDTLVFENLENGLLYNVSALSAIALARVVFKNCRGFHGLPNWNSAGYWEYRDRYIKLAATIIEYDCPEIQLVRIDNQTTSSTITVTNTGQSAIPPLETMLLLGVHAANILNANGGSVAVAGQFGEVSTFATINQGYNTQPRTDSYIRLGRGCTIANVNRIGGAMVFECGISGTLTMRNGAGDVDIYLSGAFPTIKHFANGSSIFYLSSGTITTMTLGAEATFNAERNQAGFVITNAVQAYLGASYLDKNRKATWAGVVANGCGIGSATDGVFVDRGESRTWLDS